MSATTDGKRIFLVGDSHTICYPQSSSYRSVAADESRRHISFHRHKASNGKIIFDFVVDGAEPRSQVNPLVVRILRELGFFPPSNHDAKDTERHLVLCFGGMEAHREANRHWAGYDFILPGHEDLTLDEACTLVPFHLVRAQMLERFELLKRGLALLAREIPDRKWLVFSPPPCRTNDRLRATLSRIKGIPADKLILPPPSLRLKLWLLTKEILEEICKETDHSFIDTWETSRSMDGFLAADYEHDGMHANACYGRQMALRIVEAIEAGPDSETCQMAITLNPT